MKQTPFDFSASLTMPNWQDDFVNLVNDEWIDLFCVEQDSRIAAYIQSLDNDKKRDNFLLSLLVITNRVNALLVALNAMIESDEKNIELISTLPELIFLKTGDEQLLKISTKRRLVDRVPNFIFFRRLVRTASWTKWWRLPLVFFKPQVIAIGHNEIVKQYAKQSKKRVYFYQASELLKRINQVKNTDGYLPSYLEILCQEVYDVLLGHLTINKEPYFSRFKKLVEQSIKQTLIRDAKALNACYAYNKLPKQIWIGTGYGYAFRLLALSVLRQKGKVTSFGHAKSTVFANLDRHYFGEFAVTNKFIDISAPAQKLFNQDYLTRFSKSINKPFSMSSLTINNKFKPYQKNKINKLNDKPVVLYASNAMIDLASKGAPFSNYMAYLKWQLDLTELLDSMDINLICQPHPEGIFQDKSLVHPLREKYDIPYQNFETIMAQADVFLIDFIHSTVVGEMLVTDKPIVRIGGWFDKLEYYGIPKRIKPFLDKRCRLVEAKLGNNNIPYVNKGVLEKVLIDNWQEKVDSSAFRELLIGTC